MTQRVAVLTPVRNGEEDLPGFLASVEQFADFVVALDDGSTDATRSMLEAAPIVATVLANPPRPTYVGWDDARNRQELLDELENFEDVGWVVFLDADERIDPDDAAALRHFIETDAISSLAYGFEVFRMADGTSRYDPGSHMWVYRMFGYRPGLQLPTTRLHFVPIPESIERKHWIRTTLRIQHLGSADEQRRATRFRKYQEADPDVEFQGTYENLLAAPERVADWPRRVEGTAVVVSAETQFATVAAAIDAAEEQPIISAVVIAQNDEDSIATSVRALVDQELDQPMEIIVVASGTDRTAQVVRDRFPSVRVIELPRPALPGEARNAGLWVAGGHYISFPGSHVVVAPGSVQARVEAHEQGWDLVTGTTLNGNPTNSGWASYFLDHFSVLPDRPSGEMGAAPSHCSYVREDLNLVGGFPENMRAGEDTVVNLDLFDKGRTAYREAGAAIVHSSRARSVGNVMRHHFGRGRAWGRILQSRLGWRRQSVRSRLLPILEMPWRRVRLVSASVSQWGGSLTAHYRKARWQVILGAIAAGAGTLYQVLRGGPDFQPPMPAPPQPPATAPSMIVAHHGSPRASQFGILGYGSRAKAVDRVRDHVDRQAPGVATPALYVVGVAATVLPSDEEGAYWSTLPREQIDAYLTEARLIGGRLIIGIQPSRGSFTDALTPLQESLSEPDVGVGLQPQWSGLDQPSRAWPGDDIDKTLEILDGLAGADHPMLVVIHDTPAVPWPQDWSPSERNNLDIVGLVDAAGTSMEAKAEALGRLAERAPQVGVQIHYGADPQAPEPQDLAQWLGDLRIAIYQ